MANRSKRLSTVSVGHGPIKRIGLGSFNIPTYSFVLQPPGMITEIYRMTVEISPSGAIGITQRVRVNRGSVLAILDNEEVMFTG